MTTMVPAGMALRRRTVLAAAIAVMGLTSAAGAFAAADPVDIRVIDRQTGEPLKVWRHDGRLFVAGQPGSLYALRVTNHTGGRVQVVMSVDGVNVVSGETASFEQTGYILDAYQSYDVTGWRKSTSEVAAFSFAPLPKSYAARTGRPADVGVIGMAVFKEKAVVPVPAPRPEAEVRPDWRDDVGRRSSDTAQAKAEARAAPPPPMVPPAASGGADSTTTVTDMVVSAPKRQERLESVPVAVSAFTSAQRDVAQAEPRDEKLGTGFGAREVSMVTMVDFERATSYPVCIRRIEYDTYNNLVASGVIAPPPYEGHRPQPFPANPDGAGFVPDPPPEP